MQPQPWPGKIPAEAVPAMNMVTDAAIRSFRVERVIAYFLFGGGALCIALYALETTPSRRGTILSFSNRGSCFSEDRFLYQPQRCFVYSVSRLYARAPRLDRSL